MEASHIPFACDVEEMCQCETQTTGSPEGRRLDSSLPYFLSGLPVCLCIEQSISPQNVCVQLPRCSSFKLNLSFAVVPLTHMESWDAAKVYTGNGNHFKSVL